MAVPTIFNPWAILAVVMLVPIAAAGGYMKGHADAEKDCRLESLENQLNAQRANQPNLPRP